MNICRSPLLLTVPFSQYWNFPFLNSIAQCLLWVLSFESNRIGVGKADITGPVVEVEFAGYADLSQLGTGLRQRLYSRAFIIGDVNNPDDRFVYLVLDAAAGDTAQRYGILERLAALGDEYSVYGQANVAVTGTHSHNGPGAWWNYLLVSPTAYGFAPQSLTPSPH